VGKLPLSTAKSIGDDFLKKIFVKIMYVPPKVEDSTSFGVMKFSGVISYLGSGNSPLYMAFKHSLLR
jgi:hypothetical protein